MREYLRVKPPAIDFSGGGAPGDGFSFLVRSDICRGGAPRPIGKARLLDQRRLMRAYDFNGTAAAQA